MNQTYSLIRLRLSPYPHFNRFPCQTSSIELVLTFHRCIIPEKENCPFANYKTGIWPICRLEGKTKGGELTRAIGFNLMALHKIHF